MNDKIGNEIESCRSPRTVSVRTYVSSLDRAAGTFCSSSSSPMCMMSVRVQMAPRPVSWKVNEEKRRGV